MIPDKLFEIWYPPRWPGTESRELYEKHMHQIWQYKRWLKRAYRQIPELTERIFRLTNHKGMFTDMKIRQLGQMLTELNEYDDCPPIVLYVSKLELKMRVRLGNLFRTVINAERRIENESKGPARNIRFYLKLH